MWGIIGHGWAVDLLAQRIAANRLAHSILFTGPPGTGKTTLALALARMLNCTGDAPPCGVCRACTLIQRRAHPDIQIVEAEAGSSLKIDRIRELQQSLALAPFEARYRVAIVRNVHQATPGAADALLKVVEEPPPSVRLLLTADLAQAVTPTLVSRCQVVGLRGLSASIIEQALVEQWQASPTDAALVARLSGGRLGWAANTLSDPDALAERHQFLEDLDRLLHAGRVERFAYAEMLNGLRERVPALLDTWQAWWRDVMLTAEGSAAPATNQDWSELVQAQAMQIGPEAARQALHAVRRAIEQLDRNANLRLTLEVLMLDLPQLS